MKVRMVAEAIGLFLISACATVQVPRVESPELTLSFETNKTYDENNVMMMFRDDDPLGLVRRAATIGIDIAVARKIHDAADPSEAHALAARFVDERFERSGPLIEASREEYARAWKDLLPVLARVVVETTESPWRQREYVCVVSAVFPGLSSWNGNVVAAKYDHSAAYKRRLLAHEIVLSDVFRLLRMRYATWAVGDWQVWAFSEITASLILDDSRLEHFWPGFPPRGAYSGYTQLAEPSSKLAALFAGRRSYRDYEDAAVALLNALPPAVLAAPAPNGWAGVYVRDLADLGDARGLAAEMNLEGKTGTLVAGIYKGSPADAAGLMAGDYVTSVGSARIDSAGELVRVIGALSPGTAAAVVVLRAGAEKTLTLRVGERDAYDRVVAPGNLWPGLLVAEATDHGGADGDSGASLGGPIVASLTSNASPAAVIGLRPGDVITAVNGIPVTTLAGFYEALNAHGGRSASITITRNGGDMTLPL